MRLADRFRWLALAVALIALPAVALAQARSFKDKDLPLLGTLEVLVFPQARLDGREVLLAPGTRIFNTDSAVAIPSTVKGPVPVRYRLDTLGQVNEAWILTTEELRQAQRERSAGGRPAGNR
jgi:hypothetical protein